MTHPTNLLDQWPQGRHDPVVYYVTNMHTEGVFKIGTTIDLHGRMRRMVRKIGEPFTPLVLAIEAGDERLEYARHRESMHWRCFLDWRWLVPESRAWVATRNGFRP